MEGLNIKNLLVIPFTLLCLVAPVLSIQAYANDPVVLEYFKMSEFADRYAPHEVKMNPEFLLKLDELRRLCGFPINISSGYRSPKHPNEKHKRKPGTHSKGIAVDIKVTNRYVQRIILRHALALKFAGIGMYPSHIHLDDRKTKPVIWIRDKY